jgi:hypothetical protein
MAGTRRLAAGALALVLTAAAFAGIATTAVGASRAESAPRVAAPPANAFPATNGAVLAMVRHGSTLYIGGKFSTVGGSKRNGLAAIDLTNRSLLPWAPRVGPVGKEYNPVEVRALAVSPDGATVYIGGHFDFITGVERANLAAVSTSQAGPVTDWNPVLSGNPYGGVVNALALNQDGSTLYVGGAFQAVNGSQRSGLAAINTTTGDGGAWAPLVTGAPSFGYAVNALALDEANGRLFVGGHFSKVANDDHDNVAAVSTTGIGAATSFDPDLVGDVASLSLDPDNGVLYLGGSFQEVNGAVRKGAAAVPLNGGGSQWYSIFGGFNPRIGMVAVGPDRSSVLVAPEPGQGPMRWHGSETVGAAIAETGLQGVHAVVFTPEGDVYAGGEHGVAIVPMYYPPVLPTLSIGNASVIEGDDDSRIVRVTVSASGPRRYSSSFHYETTNGSATPGTDYIAKSGDVAMAGQTAWLDFFVRGDLTDEPNEFFRIKLSNPGRAVLGQATGVATITDDDVSTGVRASIGNASITEGDLGGTRLGFTVALSKPHTAPVDFQLEIVGGTATEGSDFVIETVRGTIAPGRLYRTFVVPVIGDRVKEPDERFTVRVKKAPGVTIVAGPATGTIVDDD